MDIRLKKYIADLPINSAVAAKVLNLTEEGLDISFKELENIIKIDPGLTARVLKVANSALYARQKEIENLQQAITLLGFKTLKSLILLVTASGFFQKAKKTKFSEMFWKHSLVTAFIAKSISQQCGKNEIAETSFISGLLHNIGKAVLFHAHPDKYLQVIEREKATVGWSEKIETELYSVDHKMIGGELFRSWNFPQVFIDVAEEHDNLNITSAHKTVIIFVTIAGLLADKLGYGVWNSEKENLLKTLQLYTALSSDDLVSYEKTYINSLNNDPFYKECQELFDLSSNNQ